MVFGDYHIHSGYSKDAKSTVAQNIQVAIEKGLKEIAITDHYVYHMYGIKPDELNQIVRGIDLLNKEMPINILKGVEANLIDQKGNIDLPRSEQDKLDIVVLGYHKSGGNIFNRGKHTKMRKNTPKNVELNTQAYLTALENNKINIVAHPNYACPIDVVRIAEYCKEHNIFFELNGRKNCIDDETFRKVIATGVKFIMDSDAHSADRVGDVRLGLTIMEKFDIPENQIANLNKTPDFSKRC